METRKRKEAEWEAAKKNVNLVAAFGSKEIQREAAREILEGGPGGLTLLAAEAWSGFGMTVYIAGSALSSVLGGGGDGTASLGEAENEESAADFVKRTGTGDLVVLLSGRDGFPGREEVRALADAARREGFAAVIRTLPGFDGEQGMSEGEKEALRLGAKVVYQRAAPALVRATRKLEEGKGTEAFAALFSSKLARGNGSESLREMEEIVRTYLRGEGSGNRPAFLAETRESAAAMEEALRERLGKEAEREEDFFCVPAEEGGGRDCYAVAEEMRDARQAQLMLRRIERETKSSREGRVLGSREELERTGAAWKGGERIPAPWMSERKKCWALASDDAEGFAEDENGVRFRLTLTGLRGAAKRGQGSLTINIGGKSMRASRSVRENEKELIKLVRMAEEIEALESSAEDEATKRQKPRI